jgi:predicted GNAT family N-acyltransferase
MTIHVRPQASNEMTSLSNDSTKNTHVEKSQIRNIPIYDNYSERLKSCNTYSVKMVRDFEDMAKIIAIRASACFTDPEHLYAKHFDGNDFSATHLIGHIQDEPVATIRIRYFAEFARIERLTVRPTHRKSRIAFRMVQAAFAFCRDKGYRRLSGVAREEMVPFWSLFGGMVTCSKDPIFIYGLPHFEMHIDFPQLATAITADSDPMLLLRPEGRWHEAGRHETINATKPIAVTAPPPTVRSVRRPADVAERLAARIASGRAEAGAPQTIAQTEGRARPLRRDQGRPAEA